MKVGAGSGRRGFAARVFAIILMAATGLLHAPAAGAVQVRKAGTLTVPANASLMAFCTDPTIERVVSQDLRAAKRAAGPSATVVSTLTVSVTQQLLKPGVSLNQVAPGVPEVARLIKAAGATPPPLGDTGNERDEAAVARELALHNTRPADSPMDSILSQFEQNGNLGPAPACEPGPDPQPGCAQPTPKPQPGSSGYTGDVADYVNHTDPAQRFLHHDDRAFDTVVVARASLSGSPDELIVVAVVPPTEDLEAAKKLVAEEIANAVLH